MEILRNPLLSAVTVAVVGLAAVGLHGQTPNGLQPLTGETYSDVKNAECKTYSPFLMTLGRAVMAKGMTDAPSLPNPTEAQLRMREQLGKLAERFVPLQIQYARTPFYFEVAGPCGRLAAIVDRAEKRYEKPVIPAMAVLNKSGVLVHVRPARIAQTPRQVDEEQHLALTFQLNGESLGPLPDPFQQARVVENVIIKRGAGIIRPTAPTTRPLKIVNALGASRDVNEADFFFPLAAFEPSSDITLAIIYADRTEEYLIPKMVLGEMK